ncbi:hypothetical protein [Mucilaginibacter lappiensis]|uniref:Uncharacterized protein n=1 Tax=Mucilaginibacter lappiensis TaxID=354630 RepID=A0A841JEB2_9SPHI|nr:hypothetical protein [Mucilaginibacter lappiensis]MBB6126968.1 hypothetical protein [Mucilaginibacter lappiensis]
MENDDLLIADYSNILADITVGKNAEKHLPLIKEGIKNLNTRIDSELMLGNEPTTFIKLGYFLYKLKDDAENLLSQ